jgi:polysaccharide export outer membrane protein
MRIFLFVVVGIFLLSSCVPNKRLVYFQHTQEPKPNEVTDSNTKRSYTTQLSEYTLKPNDIISLRIASITPGEYDFIKSYEEQLGLIRKLNQYNQGITGGGVGQQGAGAGGGGQTTGGGISSLTLDRMQSGFVLDSAGMLELPKLGNVVLGGLTLPQAEHFIKEKLKGYFETPVVRMQLLSFHFTILGEVNKEGRYTIYNPNATIIDALSMADNLKDFADRSSIKVVRTEGDKAEVFYVNALREDLLQQPGFYLRPNDVIIVPPLKARYARNYALPNFSATLGIISSTLALVLLIITLNK